MVATASSRHFSWSFKRGSVIIFNVFNALEEILRGDNSYKLFIGKTLMAAASIFLIVQRVVSSCSISSMRWTKVFEGTIL